jgi:hypothetical protein
LLTVRRRLFAAVTVVALLLVVVGGYLFLTRASAGTSATLTIITGTASVKRSGSTTFAAAHSGDSLGGGDTVRTGSRARAVIYSGGGAQTRLDENTTLQVSALTKSNGAYQTDLQQTAGKTWSSIERLIGGASYNVRGPNNATAGVRGTEFLVIVNLDATGKPSVRIDTFSGTVVVKSSGRDVTVTSGLSTTVASDQRAQPVVPIPTGDQTDAFTVYNQALARATLTIARPGAVARLTFSGTKGQKVFVDVPSSTLADECGIVTLEGPDSGKLNSGCIIGGNGFIDATLLPATGQYTVVVAPTHGIGNAQLVVIGDTDQQGTLLVDGAEVTAEIAQPGAVARFTFSGTARQKVFVDVPSSTLPDECGVLNLEGPDSSRLASGCIIGGNGFIDATVLPSTGQYTIVVDPTARGTGNAQVSVITASDQQGTTDVGGAAVTAAIGQPGAVARFTFSAVKGQKVFVDVPSSNLPDECGVLALEGPDSSRLASGCIIGGNGFIDATVLPSTGQYTIVVDPAAHGTGNAQVRVIGATDQLGTIDVGGAAVTAVIGQPGAVARFTFSGAKGQKVAVDVPSSTLTDECGILTLEGPDGSKLASGCIIGGKGFIDATVLPAAGQYTIVVDPAARGGGTAQVRLN